MHITIEEQVEIGLNKKSSISELAVKLKKLITHLKKRLYFSQRD